LFGYFRYFMFVFIFLLRYTLYRIAKYIKCFIGYFLAGRLKSVLVVSVSWGVWVVFVALLYSFCQCFIRLRLITLSQCFCVIPSH